MITKTTTYKGFSVPNAYYEIDSIYIRLMDELKDGKKQYDVNVNVKVYKDDTKKNELERETYMREGVSESGCSMASVRAWLKG